MLGFEDFKQRYAELKEDPTLNMKGSFTAADYIGAADTVLPGVKRQVEKIVKLLTPKGKSTPTGTMSTSVISPLQITLIDEEDAYKALYALRILVAMYWKVSTAIQPEHDRLEEMREALRGYNGPLKDEVKYSLQMADTVLFIRSIRDRFNSAPGIQYGFDKTKTRADYDNSIYDPPEDDNAEVELPVLPNSLVQFDTMIWKIQTAS